MAGENPIDNINSKSTYMDNLKVILLFICILHYSSLAYTYLDVSWEFQSKTQTIFFLPFLVVNASFFMSLFFFICGYFMVESIEKIGTKGFLKDRFMKLGIPLLTGVLLLIPLQQYLTFMYFRGGGRISFKEYYRNVYLGMAPKPEHLLSPCWPELNFGNLWFFQHLLVYAILLVLIIKIAKNVNLNVFDKIKAYIPKTTDVLLFISVVAFITYIVRMRYPVGKWVGMFGFIQAEPARLTYYIALLLLGALCYKTKWLEKIPRIVGSDIMKLGIALAVVAISLWILLPEYFKFLLKIWSFYEPVMGTALALGILLIARTSLENKSKIMEALSKNVFIVYVIHVFFVIFFQSLFERVYGGVFVKFFLVVIFSTVISFILSNFIFLPIVRKVCKKNYI